MSEIGWESYYFALVGPAAGPACKSLPPRDQGDTELRELLDRVARSYGFGLEDLIGRSRRQPLATARKVAMAEARERGFSTTAIGLVLRRDHSTVIASTRSLRPYNGAVLQ